MGWFPVWTVYRWKLVACGCLYVMGIIGLIVTITANILPNTPHEVQVPFESIPNAVVQNAIVRTIPYEKTRPLHGTFDTSINNWAQFEISLPVSHNRKLVYAALPFINQSDADAYIKLYNVSSNIHVYYHAVGDHELPYVELIEPTLYETIGDGFILRDILLITFFSGCIVGAACINLMVVCDHWYPSYGTEQYVQKQTMMAQRERLASDADDLARPASRQKLTRSRARRDEETDDDIHDSALDDAEQLASVMATRAARSYSISEEDERKRQEKREKRKMKAIKYRPQRDDDVEMQVINENKKKKSGGVDEDRTEVDPSMSGVIPALDLFSITIDPSSIPPPPSDRQHSHRSHSMPTPPNPIDPRTPQPRLSVSTSENEV